MMKRKFNLRGFTSLAVAFCLVTLTVTGVVLYVTPRCRVAYWTDWAFWGLDKDQWRAVHNTMAILFIVLSFGHLLLNWKAFTRYLKDKASTGLGLRVELLLAAGLTAGVFAATVLDVPPFAAVEHLNESIRAEWEGEASGYGNAPRRAAKEESAEGEGGGAGRGFGRRTLAEVCTETGIELEQAVGLLRERGVQAQGSDRISALAARAGTRPGALVRMLATGRSPGRGDGLGAGGKVE